VIGEWKVFGLTTKHLFLMDLKNSKMELNMRANLKIMNLMVK
jgi:hypothetical protein